ncbi:Uncharacterized protein GBIM_05708 [Gryllus bimaculatus]|nr:Uncharacterized protein GBIM_05708 [Gryllus bimaculatus]
MGVRGLQTFMEKSSPDAAHEVNIKDIVRSYRRETGREVVIVVDGSSCLRPLYGRLDWICGGQVREYVEVFQNFIQAFQDIGVKLVFFFDGPTQARKRKVWVERRLKSLMDVYRVFDLIGRGKHPSQLGGDTILLPPATSYLAAHAIKTSEGCEVHRSVKECDEEIADYARQHNCFAILGQDSDYVIYDGPQYYLSAVHLNVEKMTTINYNRWALSRQLQLAPSLLPLLASLVGNDIVRSDDLLPFHQRLCKPKNRNPRHNFKGRPSPRDVIYNVAKFIRDNVDERNLFQALPMISKRVFGDVGKASHLQLSVRSYSVNTSTEHCPEKSESSQQTSVSQNSWMIIQKNAETRFKDGNLDSMVYAIMCGLPYESSTGLEDFRKLELPPSAAVYQPLRQRIYGIILHEMPGDPENRVVEEWCMAGEGSLNGPSRVCVILPRPGSHPGLMALWDENDKSEEMLAKKWALVAHAVSNGLDPDEVSSRFLEPWEVNAFIATAVVLPTLSTPVLAKIQIEKADPRAVQLACIFGRGASIIKMLMDVSPWHYFDGKLFQTMYQKAKSGKTAIDLCNHQVAQLEQFNYIHSIVLPTQE